MLQCSSLTGPIVPFFPSVTVSSTMRSVFLFIFLVSDLHEAPEAILAWLTHVLLFHDFSNHVLKISPGIEDAGEVRFELAMCLLLGWIIVYFCVWKGIKSAGKVSFCFMTLWKRRKRQKNSKSRSKPKVRSKNLKGSNISFESLDLHQRCDVRIT